MGQQVEPWSLCQLLEKILNSLAMLMVWTDWSASEALIKSGVWADTPAQLGLICHLALQHPVFLSGPQVRSLTGPSSAGCG